MTRFYHVDLRNLRRNFYCLHVLPVKFYSICRKRKSVDHSKERGT